MSNQQNNQQGDGWFEKQLAAEAEQRERQALAARQAAEKVQAEQRAALMPQDETEAIVMKHAKAAEAEIAERAQLTAEQREKETLTGEINQLAAQLDQMYKIPSQYRAQIKALVTQMESKQARLDQLTGKTEGRDWRTSGNRVYTVIGGKVIDQ